MQKRITVWIAMMLGGIIGGLWIDKRRFSALLFNPVFHIVSLILGALLLQGVRTSSANTGRMLAKMGKEGDNVPRFETNKLVKSGVYSCMRHPMHMGLLFFPLAIALIIGSPAFIFIIAPVEMLLMIVMIKFIEEPEAIAKFGNEYREYQQQTPMFNLSLSCLKQLLGKKPPGQEEM